MLTHSYNQYVGIEVELIYSAELVISHPRANFYYPSHVVNVKSSQKYGLSGKHNEMSYHDFSTSLLYVV